MVAINPGRGKVIKLSREEQMAILRHCPYLEPDISYRIANSPDGVVWLIDYEARQLRAAIDERISKMGSGTDVKTLCKVSNKLSPNPVITSIAKQLAGRDFKDIDEVQREVKKIHERHNDTPDPEMAGLTPNQVFRLVHMPWDSDDFAVRFNKQLNIEDTQGSYLYKNSLLLLNTLVQLKNENTATVAGNLSRKTLEILFDKIILRESDKLFVTKFDRSFNEDNAYTVHETKIICQMANLIRKRGRKFIVPKKHGSLLLDENASELYHLLFSTFFRKFNLAYRDGFGPLYSIQSTIPFSFYVISKLADDFCGVKELEKRIFLPAVRKEIIDQSDRAWAVKGLMHTRIIEPLLSFGLVEIVRSSEKTAFRVEAVRKTGLFNKFLKFSV